MKILQCLPYYTEQFKGGMQKYVRNIIYNLKDVFDMDIYTTTAFTDSSIWSGFQAMRPIRGELQHPVKEVGLKKIIPINSRINNNFIYRTPSLGILLRTPVAPLFPWGVKRLALHAYDLVHFHSPSLLNDLSACLLQRQKYIVSVHDTHMLLNARQSFFTRLSRYFFIKNLLAATRIIVYRKEILYTLVNSPRLLPSLLDKTIEIPPGIDKKLYKNLGLNRTEDILFVAQAWPEKGLHVLTMAIPHLQHKQARLVVIIKASNMRKYFKQLICRARSVLKRKLVIIANPTDEQVRQAYNQCGCVVCPSLTFESWNSVLMDAASCGAALVKTDLEGMAWIREPFCLTAKVNDVRDLAKKIDLALERKEELGRMAALFVKRYSWESTASALKEVYLTSFRQTHI